MARITVDDCIKHIPNRYDLVMLASKRAKQLFNGETRTMLPEQDVRFNRHAVIALREIAAGHINQETMAAIEAERKTEEVLDSESLLQRFSEIDAKLEEERAQLEEEQRLNNEKALRNAKAAEEE